MPPEVILIGSGARRPHRHAIRVVPNRHHADEKFPDASRLATLHYRLSMHTLRFADESRN